MQRYGRAAVEAIIGQHCDNWLVIDDTGVWHSEQAIRYDLDQSVRWKYVCDLDGPDAPDPLEAPCLPIPCTASELAAFMLDGAGVMLPTIYGSFDIGPDQSTLDGLGLLASKSRDALRDAYQAHRDAAAVVGTIDESPGQRKLQLADQLDQENGDANAHEMVLAPGIAPTEARVRRERAKASIQDLSDQCDDAEMTYRAEFSRWRKAMVNQLMPSEARDAFRRQWRAVRLHEDRLNKEIEEIARFKTASISDLETKNKSLSKLRSELENVHRRLQMLRSTMSPQFQRDAEINFTIERMKRSRAIGDPQASVHAWQEDDADIKRANQEIDAPLHSSSAGSTKDNPWDRAHPEDPIATQPWYTPARYFARQLVRDDSTLLVKRSLLAAKVSASLQKASINKRGGTKPFSPASVLKALTNTRLA